MALTENRPLSEVYLTGYTPSVGSSPVAARFVSPVRGRVIKVYSVLGGGITVANATIAMAIDGTAVTGGSITIEHASSGAGVVDSAVPTGANSVDEGSEIALTPSGATGTSIPCFFTIMIERD